MKSAFLAAASILLCACVASSRTYSLDCATIHANCAQSGRMLVVGDSTDTQALLASMVAAAQRFEDLFGWTPPATALVPGGEISSAQAAALHGAGFAIQLPWLTAADKARLKESTLRDQVAEQTKNLPEQVREAALQQALQALASQSGQSSSDDILDGALAHELGHLWFISMYSRADSVRERGHAYGGFAPDWLDETFAVMMESAALRTRRRDAFRAMEADDIVPLNRFLSMTHPAADAARTLQETMPAADPSAASRIIILTKDEAEEFLAQSGGDQAAQFYAQTQVFSDFVLSRAGTAQVYVSLADWLADGGKFEAWLAAQGNDYKLPPTVQQLQQSWEAWLQAY